MMRSRYAEDRLAFAVERGVRQCVVLGAGYDTFAYRQPPWARVLSIFEVDRKATQNDKRRRLTDAGIAEPANLRFVAADFETHGLAQILSGAGFDPELPAFFSWLGVTMYLQPEAVDAVLSFVSHRPRGSEIVFTFARPESRSGPLAERAAAAGEPWRTFYSISEIDERLHALGFSSVHFHGPERGGIVAAVV